MKLRIRESNLMFEKSTTKPDVQAAKILVDAGLYDEDTAKIVIDALSKGINGGQPDIHAFVHSPSWLAKYIKGVARMLAEESRGDKNKADKFLREAPQYFERYLTWVKENREKIENPVAFDQEFVNKMSYQEMLDELDKIQEELDKQSEEEMANMKFTNSNYELIPIDSYEQFHSMFGGRATGRGVSDNGATNFSDGGAWCHANGEGTYNSWTRDGNKFYVLANKDWKNIPFDAESNAKDPKDAYGNSLIAIRVDKNGKLLNATLRCNHVGVPTNADNQYTKYSELSRIAGFDVGKAITGRDSTGGLSADSKIALRQNGFKTDVNNGMVYGITKNTDQCEFSADVTDLDDMKDTISGITCVWYPSKDHSEKVVAKFKGRDKDGWPILTKKKNMSVNEFINEVNSLNDKINRQMSTRNLFNIANDNDYNFDIKQG